MFPKRKKNKKIYKLMNSFNENYKNKIRLVFVFIIIFSCFIIVLFNKLLIIVVVVVVVVCL